jgi:hypothetical protein
MVDSSDNINIDDNIQKELLRQKRNLYMKNYMKNRYDTKIKNDKVICDHCGTEVLRVCLKNHKITDMCINIYNFRNKIKNEMNNELKK